MTEKNKKGDGRENVFVRSDDDEALVSQKTRVLGTLRSLSSTNGRKRIEFVNRDFNTAINIRRCVALETSPEEARQCNFMMQPLTLAVRLDTSRPIAGGRGKKTAKRLRNSMYTLTVQDLRALSVFTHHILQSVVFQARTAINISAKNRKANIARAPWPPSFVSYECRHVLWT